jgi:hypothetical protein
MEQYCLFVREDLSEMRETLFESETLYGMKSDLYMYKDLKRALAEINIYLSTQYIVKPEEADVIICLNETVFFTTYKRTVKY